MGFRPRENRVAFPGESQPQQSRATQPRVHPGCVSVYVIHRTLTWEYGIFNVPTDVNACDCARRRDCAKSWLWEKSLLPHRGIEPASAVCRSDALTNWATFHPLLTSFIIWGSWRQPLWNIRRVHLARAEKIWRVTAVELLFQNPILFNDHPMTPAWRVACQRHVS